MNAVATVDAVHVAMRLRELRDWAGYVRESLTRDLPWEPGKRDRLENMVAERVLAKAREEAESLFLSLRELARQAEGIAYEEEARENC